VPRGFQQRLVRRLQKAGAASPDRAAFEKIEAYFALLSRWNAKINLTALPLDKPTDETLDRLLVEPLAAARCFSSEAVNWFDLGTGGGSPAIPLKILRNSTRLMMVESKVRKAAFLREAVRVLELHEALVENSRFEELATDRMARADVVTVRAVRPDSTLFRVAAELLSETGRLLLFRPDSKPLPIPSFVHIETVPLIEGKSYLGVYGRVFHVEQRR
jgi:16S rRNA (guanine527-N7)-methyltransferase